MRTLDYLSVQRDGPHVILRAKARSFLHHQVRNMVGTLKMVGAGVWPISRAAAVLAGKDRAVAGPTAPAEGLYLVRIGYADNLNFT